MAHRDDLEARVKDAEARWQATVLGNPGECEWGFFSYGDAPAAIGGGIGMFAWFSDRQSMLDFIASSLPYCPPGPSHLDPDEVATRTSTIVAKLKLGTVSDPEGINELNTALVNCSQLTWMGTVTDLLTGDHPYALEVRQAFHDSVDDEPSSAPIDEGRTQEFFEFLQEWGF